MITVTSESMDELNVLYKRLKKYYKATDSIKLNENGSRYQISFETVELNPFLKNLLNKLIDYCDKVEQVKEVNIPMLEDLFAEKKNENPVVAQLSNYWIGMSMNDKETAIEYIADQLQLPVIN
jgi:hypothetical protein